MPVPNRRRLNNQMGAVSRPVMTDISYAALGAKAGSMVVPGIGTAVGAAVGAVVGVLSRDTTSTASHIGGWDGGLTQAIAGLPASAAGIGRQIPWNENSHGLVQMIEALLAVGAYMAWDSSLKSSYDVAAHWAMTFGAAVQAVAQAIASNPAGQTVSVSIALSPGAGGKPPFTFTFVNPGIQAGPDKASATVIMGPNGLMGAMMTALGGQQQGNIVSNENNALAQKVYALMLDYWFAQYHPAASQPSTPVPNVTPAVAAASTVTNQAAASAPPAPPAMATPQPIQQQPIQAQQMPQQQAPQIVVVPGQSAPTVVAPTSEGMSTNKMLLIGVAAVAAIFLLKK